MTFSPISNGRIFRVIFQMAILFLPVLASAQPYLPTHDPQGYFRYPVDARIGIASDFGELRPNHYHMGLDIRTNQVQNRPVRAAASGFVSHVEIEPFGFGRAIYIQHPGGLTTVYGHLNGFFPALERYVVQRQYQLKSWQVFLDIPPGMFPVHQGQFIAYSGNTGGSLGPHCHFEIRVTHTDKVLNPLLFGFPIPDDVPPTIVRLAVYDRNLSTYSQTPELYPLRKTARGFAPQSPTIWAHSNRVSFGISAFDQVSGSLNPTGIYESILYVDHEPVMGFRLDSLTYQETRYINGQVDYKTHASGGPYIQYLFRLPGCPNGVAYRDFSGDGVLIFHDHEPHSVKIRVRDPGGNSSDLNFQVQLAPQVPVVDPGTPSQQDKNPLEFTPGQVNIFADHRVEVILGPEAIYDSFAFHFNDRPLQDPLAFSDLLGVESGLVPLQDSLTLLIKPDRPVPPLWDRHLLIRRTWDGESEYVRATRRGQWYRGRFRSLGNFQLIADLEPPLIRAGFRPNAHLGKATRLVIYAKDNDGPVSHFSATLDGKWLLFCNDKQKAYIYTFDAHCPRGRHTLKVTAEDKAGNVAQRTFYFTR